MPIGVPKVPYKVPGSMNADWIDLYNKLYRERLLFLGQVDDQAANQLIAIMLYLDSEDSKKDINLYINSPGGSVSAGLAIFDTMRHINCDVATTNVGLAASMGSLLLCGGTKGKRVALPRSRTMIHQPATNQAFQGQASDIKVEAQEIKAIKEQIADYYSKLTGKTKSEVMTAIARDNFMSAQEALELVSLIRSSRRTRITSTMQKTPAC
jgi:ATP-dependent Clp endopeptidase proteolytic subunit ClpP